MAAPPPAFAVTEPFNNVNCLLEAIPVVVKDRLLPVLPTIKPEKSDVILLFTYIPLTLEDDKAPVKLLLPSKGA